MGIDLNEMVEEYRVREKSVQSTNPGASTTVLTVDLDNEGFVSALQLDTDEGTTSAPFRFMLRAKDASGDIVTRRPLILSSTTDAVCIDGERVQEIPAGGKVELQTISNIQNGDTNAWLQVLERR